MVRPHNGEIQNNTYKKIIMHTQTKGYNVGTLHITGTKTIDTVHYWTEIQWDNNLDSDDYYLTNTHGITIKNKWGSMLWKYGEGYEV